MLGVSALWVNGLPFARWLVGQRRLARGALVRVGQHIGKGKGRY